MPAEFHVEDMAARSRFYWYNDYNMTPIHDLWPEIKIKGGQLNRMHCLDFIIRGDEIETSAGVTLTIEGCWNEVVQSLSDDARQKFSMYRYLEVTLNGNVGILNIDLARYPKMLFRISAWIRKISLLVVSEMVFWMLVKILVWMVCMVRILMIIGILMEMVFRTGTNRSVMMIGVSRQMMEVIRNSTERRTTITQRTESIRILKLLTIMVYWIR